jgi:hypothetical protein
VAGRSKRQPARNLFEIVPATAYPDGYRAVVAQGKKEIQTGFHPELKTNLASVADYDGGFRWIAQLVEHVAPPVAIPAGHDWSGKPSRRHDHGGVA